jgi:nitric oxide reductase NorD protein
MRHAAHYLAAQKADKKLLLMLTDGQPADVDVHDERLLIEDARKAVGNSTGRASSATASASIARPTTYVGDIFGRRYSVIDNIERCRRSCRSCSWR